MPGPLVGISDLLEHHTRVAMLPSLVATLKGARSDEHEAVSNALGHLATIVDTLYGEDAEAFCEYLRVAGAVSAICDLCVSHPAPEVHHQTLMLLGNLASEAVDSQASLTKAIIRRHGTFEVMAASLFSSDWTTLVYALGAVQNICHEMQYACQTPEGQQKGIPAPTVPTPDWHHTAASLWHQTHAER